MLLLSQRCDGTGEREDHTNGEHDGPLMLRFLHPSTEAALPEHNEHEPNAEEEYSVAEVQHADESERHASGSRCQEKRYSRSGQIHEHCKRKNHVDHQRDFTTDDEEPRQQTGDGTEG